MNMLIYLQVYTVETNPLCYRVIKDFIKHNSLCDKITVLDKRLEDITSKDIEIQVRLVTTVCAQFVIDFPIHIDTVNNFHF